MNTTFVVDWDGTCVENTYPDQGDWQEGARDALYLLDRLGTVIIYSVRIAPVKPFLRGIVPPAGSEEPFEDNQPEREYAYIRSMLDQAGLGHVEIWQRAYKPPAFVYIDDRAVHHTGSWKDTIEEVLGRFNNESSHPTSPPRERRELTGTG